MSDFAEWRDQLFDRIGRAIFSVGWMVMYVGGGCDVPGCDGDHPSDADALGVPPYGYTVGLPFRFGHPELVVVGLDAERTSWILNALGDGIDLGARFERDVTYPTNGVVVKFAACAPSFVRDGLIAVSMDYHASIGHNSMPSPLQVVWPDASGRYPDDPLADVNVRRSQKMLRRKLPRDHRRIRQRPRRPRRAEA